jgi:hypothetical protein
MGDTSNIPESIRLAAEQHGLGRALDLFPELVKAAAERGLKPLGNHRDVSSLMAPAPIFNPARFDHHK